MDTPGVNWDMTTNNRNSEVFVAKFDGTNAVNISNNSAFDGWPVWIDDETVLFSSNRAVFHCNSRSLLEAIAKTDVSRHSVSSRRYI